MHQKLIPDPILILLNNPKQSLHARILLQIRYFERELSKSFKEDNYFSFEPHVIRCVTRMSFACYLIRMPVVCTRMSSACHSYVLVCHPYITHMYSLSSVCHSHVLVCHPYITHMYSYVIRMSLACTRMSSVCHSYVLVCHPYVTCMYSYAIRKSLVCTRMSSVCHSYVVLP